jgi:hexosaminidase
VNYLQLHLTDDQSFTFPCEKVPRLPTPGLHYTREELIQLDEFARDRGVVLLPEIEVPGHSAQFTERMPEVFAIAQRDSNPSTINMGREAAKKHGKQTLLGEGFHAQGKVEIPRDITVMAWETIYQLPQDLIAGGYRIISGSWKPLYVVNEKKWDVEYIYGWNLWRWENWVEHMPSYTPIQLEPSPAMLGATMESWHQPQHVVLPTVRRRLAAMSERTRNASLERIEPDRPYTLFRRNLDLTDLDAGLAWVVRYTLDGSPVHSSSALYQSPIRLGATTTVRARAYNNAGKPVGYERWHIYELRPIDVTVTRQFETPADELWEKMDPSFVFPASVLVTLRALRPGTIRYTTDDSEPSASSPAYTAPLEVDTARNLHAQLFDAAGRAVGKPWIQSFKRAQ